MKLATTTGDFWRYIHQNGDAIPYLAAAGFKYLDYDFHGDSACNSGFYGEDWEAYIEKVQADMKKYGVKFIQAHSPFNMPVIVNRQVNKDLVARAIRSVEICAKLGIPQIVVHSGYERGLSVEETMELNKQYYMEILPTAEKYGINILTENFNKMCCEGLYWIDNATDQRRLIDLVNHPLFHGCWDTGHANMQEMSEDEGMRIVGSHILGLHVNDNDGTGDQHVELFRGTMNIDSVMKGIFDIGYKGYFTFESTNLFPRSDRRRPFEGENRMKDVPLDVWISAEKTKYEIGKAILTAYGCFEE